MEFHCFTMVFQCLWGRAGEPGGVCYSLSCGINLSGIFALRKLGIIDKETAIKMGTDGFKPVVVRSVSSVITLTEQQSAE